MVKTLKHFPGGSAVKNLPADVGDVSSIPGSGRFPGEGNDNPLQYSCLGKSHGPGAWQATVHGVANRWGNNGNSDRFYFGGSKITADGDCRQEIKKHLLLGRKNMITLDSILKSTDITLPTKVRLVKAMDFPVVTYVCESWTIKKAEHRGIDGLELWCWRRLLRVPWTVRRSKGQSCMQLYHATCHPAFKACLCSFYLQLNSMRGG